MNKKRNIIITIEYPSEDYYSNDLLIEAFEDCLYEKLSSYLCDGDKNRVELYDIKVKEEENGK